MPSPGQPWSQGARPAGHSEDPPGTGGLQEKHKVPERWSEAPWPAALSGVALSLSLVKYMGSLDVKSVTGGHAAHSAAHSFERAGPTPDLCEEVNSADSSYGKALKYLTLSYGSWPLCVPTSTSFWEPGQTSAQNERKA